MEGVGDRAFRRAMASIGGFDQACTEFIRVPTNAHIPSLCKEYVANETHPIPQAAQIMGSDPHLMGEMARAIAARGAPRIDLNCGCPSNTVTGRGAGSSLLKTPELLNEIASSMVKAVSIPVTAKLRSGYTDISLFRENLLAAQESGIAFLTLHPRTKVDGYGPPARWDLIAEAKSILTIPLVGNGDILTVADAHRMLEQTKCDALMIGRGAVINPWIFQEIKASFAGTVYEKTEKSLDLFYQTFIADIPEEIPVRTRINKLKQIASFQFRANEELLALRSTVLTGAYQNEHEFLERTLPLLKKVLFTDSNRRREVFGEDSETRQLLNR
ncbi:MAG: tRNA-dihydrouridine synthase family protein [Verrucomicrobia bacterium]|nr:tRNA-dihydrouridine synthase family protein [Verrucomicrobiota bacterium]